MSTFQRPLDHSVILCLACSSSLPPRAKNGQSKVDEDIFTTPCCSRPICPSCISANPRLQRYNPCLFCLGGIGVVGAGKSYLLSAKMTPNIDGAVRDEDNFVIGEDEDADDEEEEPYNNESGSRCSMPPPPYPTPSGASTPPTPSRIIVAAVKNEENVEQGTFNTTDNSAPPRYYIQRNDTLRGIALRFGMNEHDLCRMNNLPPSTLSTTPHLLHTRVSLVLPPSASTLKQSQSVNIEKRDGSRVREQAEKQFQLLTKETDSQIAKAYVALADDPEEALSHAMKMKMKEAGSSMGASSLEARAIDQYLEDDTWEERQKGAMKRTVIQRFPGRKLPGM